MVERFRTRQMCRFVSSGTNSRRKSAAIVVHCALLVNTSDQNPRTARQFVAEAPP